MAAANKNLFKADSSYKFEPGLDAKLKYSETIRNVSPDFLERILTVGGITKTDLFLLRAVLFYRIATADMVVEFLQYFRHFYGAKECEKLLVGNVASKAGDPLLSEDDAKKDIGTIFNRLLNMSKKHLLFCYKLENSTNFSGGGIRMSYFAHRIQHIML